MFNRRILAVYFFAVLLSGFILCICLEPASSQCCSATVSPFYRRADGLIYYSYDVYGWGQPTFRDIVMAWSLRHPGEEISRSLPLPNIANGIAFDSLGRPTWGDQYWSGSAPRVPFDYNRTWETRCGTNLVAFHPHAWLLGQLKNVGAVEAFSPYESDKIFSPVFEFEDDYKLPNSYQFCYQRAASCWISATSRVEGAESERKQEEFRELLKVSVLSLIFFAGVRSYGLSKRFSERGFQSQIFKSERLRGR